MMKFKPYKIDTTMPETKTNTQEVKDVLDYLKKNIPGQTVIGIDINDYSVITLHFSNCVSMYLETGTKVSRPGVPDIVF